MINAAPEQPLESDQANRRRHMLSVFQKRQAEDPMFLQRILDGTNTDWGNLPETERETIALVGQFLHPDSPSARAQTTRAYLLINHLVEELEQSDVSELHQEPPAPSSATL